MKSIKLIDILILLDCARGVANMGGGLKNLNINREQNEVVESINKLELYKKLKLNYIIYTSFEEFKQGINSVGQSACPTNRKP